MASSAKPKSRSRGQELLNLIMRAVLATPLLHRAVSNRVLVIQVVGRKSGRTYRIPIGYTPHGDALLVGTAGTWRRNLSPGTAVEVVLERRRTKMAADVVTDEQRCADFYRAILAHNPVHGRYAGIRTDPDGSPNRADLKAALARGIAVVRLMPATGRSSTGSAVASPARTTDSP